MNKKRLINGIIWTISGKDDFYKVSAETLKKESRGNFEIYSNSLLVRDILTGYPKVKNTIYFNELIPFLSLVGFDITDL